MSVFIRKLLDGGVTLTQTDTSSTDQNKDFSAQAPKFSIGQYQVNLNNFVGDLNNNFQTFYDVYEGTWTEQEKRDVLREHQLFLLNLLAGNITGIDSAGRFNVVNPSYSGIDFNNPSWGIYSYYVKRISDLYKSGLDNESSKSKKIFTNTSILRDIHNKFFGGTENPDYRAFFDLDEVVTNSDGKKVRGVKNRVNALLDLLNENYLSQYDSVDESLGGMDEVRKRIDRLRFALADGTLNNEDYASAAALGLNLRGLLSTDGNLLFDSNGGFASSGDSSSESSSDSSTTKSAADQLKEMVYGPTTTAEDLLNKMKSWNGSVNVEYNVGPLSNFSATEYLQERMSARNESSNGTAEYYRKEFYPKFFENLKTYTPEYLKQNGNNVVKTWRGDETLNDYVKTNLTLAIRNKLYGQSSLLSDDVNNELNQIVGTDFWTVPKSFDENTGTVLLFNPNTGAYKRVSILDRNLKFISTADGKAHSLIEDYVYGTQLQVASAKKGAKLQLGGNINKLGLSGTLSDDLKNEAFSALFLRNTPQEQLTSTQLSKKSEEEMLRSKQAEYLKQQGMTDADIRELWSAGLDLVSLGSAFIPEVGTAVSLATGLTSTGLHTYNLATDEDGFTLGDLGETAGNVGLDLVGLIPGFGTAAKGSGKTLKTITKFAPVILGIFGTLLLPEAAASLKKLTTDGFDALTVQDYRNLTNGIMAIVGAGTYHLAAKPKAEAMSEAYGRQRVETGEIRVKVGEEGAPKTVKIDADELPVFREKLEKAKGNKEKVEEVLRESPSIKRQVAEEDLGKVTFVEKPTTTILGVRVPFTSKTKGLETKPEIIEGSNRLGNSLDERIFKWQLNAVERLGNLRFKNPVTEYYRKRYDIPESGSARTSETPGSSVRSEAAETPRASAETPRSEASAAEAPRAEAPATETPVVETPRAEEPSVRRSEEPKAEEPKAEEPKAEEAPAIEMGEKRREARKAKKGTDSNASKIYSSREKVRKLLKSNSIPKENAEKLSEYLGSLKKGERIDPDKVKECLKSDDWDGQLSLPFSKNGSKLLKIILFKQTGGILKGQTGLTFEDYKKLYLQQELGNKHLKPYNTIANMSVLNDHNSDFTLLTAYNKNTAYTGNRDLVGQDLLNYLNSRKYNTIEDFIANYNKDAEKIRSFWNLTHKANTEKGENIRSHNTLFREMFKNRSDASNNNPSYNIGYDDKIEDIMGSSTWMRRMDRYASKFDINNPDVSRIHKITLPNGDYGYVYKEQDGSIGLVDKALGDKLISQISQGNPQASGNPQTTSGLNPNNGNNYVWGVGDGNDYNWQLGGIQGGITGVGSRRNIDLYKYLPATLAFGRMVGDIDSTNRRVKRYLGSLQVPVQTPYEFHRQIYGDYGSLKQADDLAALVRSQMNRPTTSNATLAALQRLEGEKLAAEQQWKGHLADNQMIHKTYEQSAAEEKENIKRRTDAANTNRGLFAEDARLRANAIASADAANRNSYDAWQMAYVEKPIAEEANRRKAYQEWYDYASIGPMEYDFRGDPYLLDAQRRLSETTDEKTRAAILRDAENYRISKAASYKIAQLRKFRLLNPYIQQRIPFDDSNLYHVLLAKKGGSVDIYGSALLKAKSKDNDRLIKQVLDVIKNHKDLVKGVRTPDYSKYIIRNLR